MNSQISSKRLPAFAAMFMILSGSAVLAQGAEVRGSFSGYTLGVVQGTTLQAAGSVEGSASHIGRFSCTVQATVDLTNNTSGVGVFVMSFPNGDVIYGTLTGVAPSMDHVIEQLTITGGTGRFQGATGSMTFDRFGDVTTLPAYSSTTGTLTGTINTPK